MAAILALRSVRIAMQGAVNVRDSCAQAGAIQDSGTEGSRPWQKSLCFRHLCRARIPGRAAGRLQAWTAVQRLCRHHQVAHWPCSSCDLSQVWGSNA